MLSRHRKSVAALACVTAALAVGLPAASASATPTVDPQVCTLLSFAEGPFGPTMFFGGSSLGAVLQHAGSTVNCPAPAQPTSPWHLPGFGGFQVPGTAGQTPTN